jgi:hypothetical protein
MKKNRLLALSFVGFSFGLLGGGCASSPPASVPPRPKTVTLNLKSSSLDDLSEQLSQVKGSQVTVSTRALKSLLMNQKTLQNQCRSLSTQLEALKSLDIEEYESRE